MNRLIIVTLLAVVIVADATPSHAAIIRVEKDGSGDYVTLQEGLDAAQPGDTVRVGPGRYDTFSVRTFAAGGTLQVVGFVSTSGITIEGANREAVRIGPVGLTRDIGGISTAGIGIDVSAVDVHVSNISVENTELCAGTTAARTTWESVSVLGGGQTGLQSWATDGLVVRDCLFSDNAKQSVWLVAQVPSQNVLIEGCTVENSPNVGLDIGTAQNVTVRSCTFRFNGTSVMYWNGAQGAIKSCDFQESRAHVFASTGTTVSLNNSTFAAGALVSLDVTDGLVTGSQNFFGGGTVATLRTRGNAGYLSLSNCTIQNGGAYSVRAESGSLSGHDFLDLRNNYWGTSDPAQIAEWIWDVNDFPQFPEAIPAAFEPFLEQSVRTEDATMGSIKALFADPK